jgi:hypothetical protein
VYQWEFIFGLLNELKITGLQCCIHARSFETLKRIIIIIIINFHLRSMLHALSNDNHSLS